MLGLAAGLEIPVMIAAGRAAKRVGRFATPIADGRG
jgi:hypothetical protein